MDTKEALERLFNNSDEFRKILDNIPPDMLEKAKKVMASGGKNNVIDKLHEEGIDTDELIEAIREVQEQRKKEIPTKRQCILLNSKRQIKQCYIYGKDDGSSLVKSGVICSEEESKTKSDALILLPCSRLSVGSLSGKKIQVWCTPNRQGKNNRLSKILGYNIAGDALFFIEGDNLSEKDFLMAERLLK